MEETDFPILKYRFITEDIDEEMNGGQFASDTTQVIFDSEELTGGDGWYEGSASKEIKITLKEYVDTHTEPYALYTIYGKVTDDQGYPLAGVAILTSPAYTPTQEDDLSSFPAITRMRPDDINSPTIRLRLSNIPSTKIIFVLE